MRKTLAFVEIWRDEDIEAQLDGMRRNTPVFQRLAELLALRGFERTPKQCRAKLRA
jgi:hypothetical protein